MGQGKIIFLNGVSSSGKSTLSRELVKLMPDYFHISIDDFDVFIERMEDREGDHLIPVETEYFFHRTVAMFSDKGVNLVVDHILHDNFTREDCFKILADYPVLFVGVHCPLEELERRERARGDRNIGQAKKQLEYVHKAEIYDIEINTAFESIEENSRKIIEALNSKKYHSGWIQTSRGLLE
ncbi:AAA family ATPase [Proteiniborus sp.]|uniref:chloramphenicol phosphotransferase CPT family protein n=1 Tax=Proteiniborus sp. TaxID=2079015 RepID=UPI00331D11BD